MVFDVADGTEKVRPAPLGLQDAGASEDFAQREPNRSTTGIRRRNFDCSKHGI